MIEDEPAELPAYGPFRGSRTRVTRQQLRAQRFRRLSRDVYVQAQDAPGLELEADGILVALPDAVLSHVTAASLWRLPVGALTGWLHVTRAPTAAVSRRAGVRTHRAELAPADRDTCRGRAVTSLPRTFVDLAASSCFEELVAVGDVVLRRTSAQELSAAVARAGRRKGVALARAVLPHLDAGAASAAESRCRLVLHAAGLTALRHAVAVHDAAGQWVAEADLGDEVARVAVQYDGLLHFDGDPAQRVADVARDELTRLAGWEVVVLTARDLRLPHLSVAKVQAAYDRAEQRGLGRRAA